MTETRLKPLTASLEVQQPPRGGGRGLNRGNTVSLAAVTDKAHCLGRQKGYREDRGSELASFPHSLLGQECKTTFLPTACTQ